MRSFSFFVVNECVQEVDDAVNDGDGDDCDGCRWFGRGIFGDCEAGDVACVASVGSPGVEPQVDDKEA